MNRVFHQAAFRVEHRYRLERLDQRCVSCDKVHDVLMRPAQGPAVSVNGRHWVDSLPSYVRPNEIQGHVRPQDILRSEYANAGRRPPAIWLLFRIFWFNSIQEWPRCLNGTVVK